MTDTPTPQASGAGSWINDIGSFFGSTDSVIGPNTTSFLNSYTPSGSVARGMVGAGVLGNQFFNQQQPPGMADMQAISNTMGGTAKQYISGQVPDGTKLGMDMANQSNIQNIKNHYSNQGLSGSTMEAQAISDAYTKNQIAQATASVDMVKQGIEMYGMDAKLIESMWMSNQAENKALGDAISNFVGALSGQGTDMEDKQMLASLRRVTGRGA